eukprot:6954194-Alexandrium_andersonii.AAC.1
MSNKQVLQQIWLDFGAFVVKGPQPKYFSHATFREEQSGPSLNTCFSGKPKKLQEGLWRCATRSRRRLRRTS